MKPIRENLAEVATFADEISKHNIMSEVKNYKKWSDMAVELQHRQEVNPDMHVLNGKGLLNQHESRFTFIQNEPRGPRSVEVGRTKHCRIVRRPDGKYTATLRFGAGEQQLLAALLAEIRRVTKMAQEDMETQDAEAKAAARKQDKEGGIEK